MGNPGYLGFLELSALLLVTRVHLSRSIGYGPRIRRFTVRCQTAIA